MPSSQHYDAIVIGSGQGGTPLCQALAEAGMRTALIEREHVGGTCINEGCTPTKTMIASGRVVYLARRAGDYGVNVGSIRVSMDRVRRRKRDIVKQFRSGSEARIKKTKNLDLIYGTAAFTDPKSIAVELSKGRKCVLTAEKFFINAGCRPAVPPLDGLGQIRFLNSTSIMELAQVPRHLIVLGGGYVGLEFGQLFRRLGSRVTIVQSAPQLLAGEDADVAEAVAAILKQDGIEILVNTRAEAVSRSRPAVSVKVRARAKVRSLIGTHLLVATGRVPNTDTLNPGAAGIATDERGFIRVNEKLETSVAGIFALGDIKGGPEFTHISYDDFRIIRTNVIERGQATISNRIVPYTLFIDPQLGRVGLTEQQARAQGRAIRVAKMPMSHVARALEVDETRGFMKAIVDATSSQILGAAVLGIEGGEIMAQIQLAMMGGLPYTILKDAVFAHPTLAESLNNLFANFQS
ncbi:MAG TPA: mercuric reductase [Candidatus Acidoferrales bacterium]|nr:mercuric reductase [Candidatus Acidoferrales bacterium]